MTDSNEPQLGNSSNELLATIGRLGLGTWRQHGPLDVHELTAMMDVARAVGIRYFDTADSYDAGAAERRLGDALIDLGWPRSSYSVSTKLFFGTPDGQPSFRRTLRREYLIHGTTRSLERLRLDHVDILYCHRFDPETPIEQVVETMTLLCTQGLTLWWGTSDWPVWALHNAVLYAVRSGLVPPLAEQTLFNPLQPGRLTALSDLIQRGLVFVGYSPLAGGLLSGKYRSGVPPNSRGSLWGIPDLLSRAGLDTPPELSSLASECKAAGVSLSQLAIAWCALQPGVSTVLLGCRTLNQLRENIGAIELIASGPAEEHRSTLAMLSRLAARRCPKS